VLQTSIQGAYSTTRGPRELIAYHVYCVNSDFFVRMAEFHYSSNFYNSVPLLLCQECKSCPARENYGRNSVSEMQDVQTYCRNI